MTKILRNKFYEQCTHSVLLSERTPLMIASSMAKIESG